MSATASLADDQTAPDPAHRIAVAAHEIRTPLGGILALADLLLAEELTDSARGHASALKTAAEHLLGVATTLLGGAAPARAAELGIDDFIGRVAPALAARAGAKGLVFRATRAPGVPDRVVAEEGALRQIIENLADNAIRATKKGSVELAVERVAGDANSVTLRIVVRDTGPGLGKTPEKLFEPYVQGPGPRGAAGLGLALVRKIAETMGGTAEATNRPQGGAEVGVTLRLGACAESGGPRSAPLHVLVAEDNDINRRVMAMLLDRFGHTYDMVMDGEEAVAAVKRGGYDIVLMDAMMPKLDGLGAARAIRALKGKAREIRIVGVTAQAFSHEIKAFEAAGADAVVVKPISVAELWRAMGSEERRWVG